MQFCQVLSEKRVKQFTISQKLLRQNCFLVAMSDVLTQSAFVYLENIGVVRTQCVARNGYPTYSRAASAIQVVT
jgi:hypothetical protein